MKLVIKYKLNYNIQRSINTAIEIMRKRQFEIKKQLSHTGTCHNFYIFNIATYQIIEISAPMDKLIEMMNFLIKKKFYDKNLISTDKFIENSLEVFDEYYNDE